MSKLPPALAARLAKRGLIKNETDKPKQSEVLHEEVIAEDYDDSDTNKFEILESKPLCETVIGCPNKSNIYHNCTDYCAKKYADVSLKPTKILRRQFQILLERFPLKDSVWEQIYEPGLKTFYFWNTVTDQVSWLPPSHPDAKISLPAEKLRKMIQSSNDKEKDSHSKSNLPNDEDSDDDDDDDLGEDESDGDDDSDDSEESRHSNEDEDQRCNKKRLKIVKQNQYDPMDPASYSNIPYGKWSDGL